MRRSVDSLTDQIERFLSRKNLKSSNSNWIIKNSPLGGVGVFAKRDITCGEEIFRDFPVILGPRTIINHDICVGCYSQVNISFCPKKCGLKVCGGCLKVHSQECAVLCGWKSEESHIKDGLVKLVTPVRGLLLNAEDRELVTSLKAHFKGNHGFEVDSLLDDFKFKIPPEDAKFLRVVCAVLDANAFEVILSEDSNQSTLRGLFPLGSLANHSCQPNTMHVFDDKHQMIVRAVGFIKEGQELFHSYTRLTWGTLARRFHLRRTKHFLCSCVRCSDPKEFGTYMSSILCNCKGNVVDLNPLASSNYQCEDCGKRFTKKEIGSKLSILGATLNSFDHQDLSIMLTFLEKLSGIVPKHSQVTVELKYKLIWILGYAENQKWFELPMELLEKKQQFCNDLLELLQLLNLGQCKMKGLLLYELFLTIQEINRRQSDTQITNQKYFDEARDILRDDIGAPDCLRT